MEYEVKFESDHFSTNELCNTITITVDINASEDDYEHEISSIYDETADVERKLEDFPENEQKRIQKLADDTAYEKSCDAYQESLEAAADRAYDEWKDRQMEGE